MERLTKAQPPLRPLLDKLLNRVEEGLLRSGLPSFDCFYSRPAELDHVYVYSSSRRDLGMFEIGSSLDDCFPESRAFQNSENVLERIAYKGERIVLIKFLAIDPAFEGKGYGRNLLASIHSHFRQTSFFVYLPVQYKRAVRFFQQAGYHPVSQEGELALFDMILLCRPYQPSGLCREARF